MYWFWYFMFAAQPGLLILGMLGLFGEEAKRAADDMAQVFGAIGLVLLVLGLVGGLVYLVLKGTGAIQ